MAEEKRQACFQLNYAERDGLGVSRTTVSVGSVVFRMDDDDHHFDYHPHQGKTAPADEQVKKSP